MDGSKAIESDQTETNRSPPSLTQPAPSDSQSPATERKTPKSQWRNKFRRTPEEPGKEKWRDASLSDKERWKEWQKAKDREYHNGSTAGYHTAFYKQKKGGWVWWFGSLTGGSS